MVLATCPPFNSHVDDNGFFSYPPMSSVGSSSCGWDNVLLPRTLCQTMSRRSPKRFAEESESAGPSPPPPPSFRPSFLLRLSLSRKAVGGLCRHNTDDRSSVAFPPYGRSFYFAKHTSRKSSPVSNCMLFYLQQKI